MANSSKNPMLRRTVTRLSEIFWKGRNGRGEVYLAPITLTGDNSDFSIIDPKTAGDDFGSPKMAGNNYLHPNTPPKALLLPGKAPAFIAETYDHHFIASLTDTFGDVLEISLRDLYLFQETKREMFIRYNPSRDRRIRDVAGTHASLYDKLQATCQEHRLIFEDMEIEKLNRPQHCVDPPSTASVFLLSVPRDLVLGTWVRRVSGHIKLHEPDEDSDTGYTSVEISEALEPSCTNLEFLQPSGCTVCPQRMGCLTSLSQGQLSSSIEHSFSEAQKWLRTKFPDSYVLPSLALSHLGGYIMGPGICLSTSSLRYAPTNSLQDPRLEWLISKHQAKMELRRTARDFYSKECSGCVRQNLCGQASTSRSSAVPPSVQFCPGKIGQLEKLTVDNIGDILQTTLSLLCSLAGHRYIFDDPLSSKGAREVRVAVKQLVDWIRSDSGRDSYAVGIRSGPRAKEYWTLPTVVFKALLRLLRTWGSQTTSSTTAHVLTGTLDYYRDSGQVRVPVSGHRGVFSRGICSDWVNRAYPWYLMADVTEHLVMRKFPGLSVPPSSWTAVPRRTSYWSGGVGGVHRLVRDDLAYNIGIDAAVVCHITGTPRKSYEAKGDRLLSARDRIKLVVESIYYLCIPHLIYAGSSGWGYSGEVFLPSPRCGTTDNIRCYEPEDILYEKILNDLAALALQTRRAGEEWLSTFTLIGRTKN
jgi:hypothetical protein